MAEWSTFYTEENAYKKLENPQGQYFAQWDQRCRGYAIPLLYSLKYNSKFYKKYAYLS